MGHLGSYADFTHLYKQAKINCCQICVIEVLARIDHDLEIATK